MSWNEIFFLVIVEDMLPDNEKWILDKYQRLLYKYLEIINSIMRLCEEWIGIKITWEYWLKFN